MPMEVAKDITREEFTSSLHFRHPASGQAPRHHHQAWCRVRNLRPQDVAAAGTEASLEALAGLFATFIDFWAIILIHPDVLIIIMLLFLSRYLLLPALFGVDGLLLAIQSSKISSLFVSGALRHAWSGMEGCQRLLATFTASNLESALSKTFAVAKWQELPLPNWIDYIGAVVVNQAGPASHHYRVAVLMRNHGSLKYRPQLYVALDRLIEATHLKLLLAEIVVNNTVYPEDASGTRDLCLYIKEQTERLSNDIGLEATLEHLRNSVRDLESLLGRSTWFNIKGRKRQQQKLLMPRFQRRSRRSILLSPVRAGKTTTPAMTRTSRRTSSPSRRER